MTQHIKWICKHHRTRGVRTFAPLPVCCTRTHRRSLRLFASCLLADVTPTVFVNGLEAGVVSSGWTPEQWLQFLEPLGADNFTGSLVQVQ